MDWQEKEIERTKIFPYYPQNDRINQGFRRLYPAMKENSFVKDRGIC
jgi:hypothetical protein